MSRWVVCRNARGDRLKRGLLSALLLGAAVSLSSVAAGPPAPGAPASMTPNVTADSSPASTQSVQVARETEAAAFAMIMAGRASMTIPRAMEIALPAEQKAVVDAPFGGQRVPKVGASMPLAETIDFRGVDNVPAAAGGHVFGPGVLGVTGSGVAVWESALSSHGATALRVRFSNVDLASGVALYVYNEEGQVWGPFTGQGPGDSGEFWAPTVFGDEVRIQLRAESLSALAASSLTMDRLLYLGRRVAGLQDTIRKSYSVPGAAQDMQFCGVTLPACSQNGMCWTTVYPALVNVPKAVAHIQYVRNGGAYICTGAYVAQSGNAPQKPYFMTANHCIATQASASSVEAYFQYNTGTCGGNCPVLAGVPRVNGATLMATGARPTWPDFTLLRLSDFPAGGARLLGWTAGVPPEGAKLVHMGHPRGAPLAFSFRRIRHDNSNLPHANVVPEPTFLYSGLATSSNDWSGCIDGGSSGGPAIMLTAGGTAQMVGQLFGHTYYQETGNVPCNPDLNATVDGALRSSFPRIKRYIYDRIFEDGFS